MRATHVYRSLLPLLCGIHASWAAGDVSAEVDAAVVLGAYIVEFDDAPETARIQSDFFEDLKSVTGEAAPRMAMSSRLFKGVSFRLGNDSDPKATEDTIGRLSRVKKVWPVRIIPRPDDDEVLWVGDERSTAAAALNRRSVEGDDDSVSAHVMSQIDKLHAEGYTGEGIRIAVLDSGVDYTHPALGGCFGPGCLISWGADLVGDAYDGTNTPVPDDDPMESCEGSFHGTHVTGLIVAQENPLGFIGAAPDASVGVYKVFGCEGGVANDVLIAAVNRAFDDGADIITASIGSSSGWSDVPTALAMQRVVEAGVPVTVAAGNEGNNGMFFAGSGALGKGVTAVASVDSDVLEILASRGSFSVNNSSSTEDFGWIEGFPVFGNLSLPLYATSNDTLVTDDACEPLAEDTPDLSGYIVLIREASACQVAQQGRNLADKGARHLIMYSAGESVSRPYLNDVPEIVAAAGVMRPQGEAWVELLNQGKTVVLDVVAPDQAGVISIKNPNTASGGYMNSRTTWGPTWELAVKPDIATVGGGVLSTYPLSMGGYATQSGTSMACPIAASIYALVAQARGTLDPAELLTVLSTTAKQTRWQLSPDAGLASVAQQGAGLAQAYDAAHLKTLASISSFSLNDTDNMPATVKFSIKNLGDEAMVYTFGHVPAVTFDSFGWNGNPSRFPNPVVDDQAELEFAEDQITVPAGGSAEVEVKPHPPISLDASKLPVYSGYIIINGTNSDGGRAESLSVPYQGVVGSMYSTSTLNSTFFLMYNQTTSIAPPTPNGTFYLPYPTDYSKEPGGIIGYPFIQFSTRLGTRALHLDLVAEGPTHDNETEDVFGLPIVGSAHGYPFLLGPRFTYQHLFNGMLEDGVVAPEGRYHFVARALKIFGNPDVAEDWETRDFPSFNLVYTTDAPGNETN